MKNPEEATDIVIVIPVFNEEGNILPLADEVASTACKAGWNYQILFVDDASSDRTWDEIDQAHQQNPLVVGLCHPRNLGQSAALWTGFKSSQSVYIATLDGDRQNDPADLPRLRAEMETSDFACGFRRNRNDTTVRRISSRLARWARQLVLRSDFQDTGCAMRVFRRDCLSAVFCFNGLHRFMPILVAGGAFRTREIEVNHRSRSVGVSKYGIWNRLGRGIVDLFAVAWYLRRQIPRTSPCRKIPASLPHLPKTPPPA